MSESQALAEFEQEVDAWFAENKPADPGFLLPETFMEVGTDPQFEFLRDWQAKVYEAGYVVMAWPKEYGGYDEVDMPRNNQRIIQAFRWLVQGWRANADIQLLLCDSHPDACVDAAKVARVTNCSVFH